MCRGCLLTVRPAPVLGTPRGLDALHVPFSYEGVVRELVARAKYRDRHAALTWLASEMVHALGPSSDTADVVTWAPTTPQRRRRRGFDQAELLAVAIGRSLGVRVRARLRRSSRTTQTGADRATRVAGPEFAMRKVAETQAFERVLVVDDVVTTGATMTAAAAALRNGGAILVVGIAAARRP